MNPRLVSTVATKAVRAAITPVKILPLSPARDHLRGGVTVNQKGR